MNSRTIFLISSSNVKNEDKVLHCVDKHMVFVIKCILGNLALMKLLLVLSVRLPTQQQPVRLLLVVISAAGATSAISAAAATSAADAAPSYIWLNLGLRRQSRTCAACRRGARWLLEA